MPAAGPLTVADLIDTLGQGLLRPLTSPATLTHMVSLPVIYDEFDQVPEIPGGVLLLVGLRPGSDAAAEALSMARSSGARTAMIKLHGEDEQSLAQAAGAHGLALIAVDDAVPWHQLDRLISAVTGGETAGGDDGRDLFVLADTIATTVGGAVAIEDLDRNVLAYSNVAGHPVDPLRRSGILARRVPDQEENRRLYQAVVQADWPVHFPADEEGGLPRCAVAVRAGREAIGSIWVIEHHHRLSPDAERSLVEASQLAAIHVLRLRSAVDVERQVRSEWLHSLLDGHNSAPATAARFGVPQGAASALVAFTYRVDDQHTAPLVRQLAIAVEQYCAIFMTTVSCASIGQTVYVLLPTVRDRSQPATLARAAGTAIGARLGHPVIAAVSALPQPLEHLVELRHEVDEVLDVLESDAERFGPVASATDVHAQLLLRHLTGEAGQNRRLINPAVGALVAYDREHDTAYRETLCAYFAALGDVARAATSLRVHPNTVRYRVRRAQELFALRIDTDDERLTTWLALRLASA